METTENGNVGREDLNGQSASPTQPGTPGQEDEERRGAPQREPGQEQEQEDDKPQRKGGIDPEVDDDSDEETTPGA